VLLGRADEVRVIGQTKEMLGIMSLPEALGLADEADVDVVLISPDAEPPVVRLMDYSKYKFEQAKAAKEASKKQREARCEFVQPEKHIACCKILICSWLEIQPRECHHWACDVF
jgi:translation initiation factor IF-3